LRALLRAIGRVFLYTAALDLASADTLAAKLQQTARHAVHYIDGGWQTLVDGLRDAAVRAGAVVETSRGVDSVVVEHGRAVAVRLHDGTELRADALVLAMPPSDALHVLGTSAAPRLAQRVSTMVAAHIACLDVALERLPQARTPVVFDLREPSFVTVQSTAARVAPDGGAVVHVFKQLDPRASTDPHRDTEEMEAALDRAQPGWRDLIVERRVLPHMLGSSLLPLASQGGLAERPGHQSEDVANVYFAGDWVGPRGFLADASFDSARQAARLIAGSTESRPELARAA
jgi:phytoene dehydrogenase-like protein